MFGIEDSMVHYLDCGGIFLIPANNTVDRSLLPDNLHPNTEGYARLAKCMGPVVDALVAGRALSSPTMRKAHCTMTLQYISTWPG